MKIPDSAELIAEDVSEISWEDMIDNMHVDPSAHVAPSIDCNTGSDPTSHCIDCDVLEP